MPYFKKFSASLCFSLLSISLVQAGFKTTTKLSEPGKMCFPQTSLHAEPNNNKFNGVMLNHYLIVSKEDHFREGLVFVGFRSKSQPDALWLFDGENWIKHDGTDLPNPFLPRSYVTLPTGRLQPVIPTSISNFPVDANAYIGDGEIWVGYGLSSRTVDKLESGDTPPASSPSSETSQDIFKEMTNNGRFNLIWEIGNPKVATAGDLGLPKTICLSITELTEIDDMVTTQ